MIRTISLTYLILILRFSGGLFAQDDTTNRDDERRMFDGLLPGDFRPFTEASYGYGEARHKESSADFSKTGLAEVKLGYSQLRKVKKYIKSLDEVYLFGTYLATDLDLFLKNFKDTGNVETKMLRFGLGRRLGYGYSVGPFALVPYHQNAIAWSKFEFDSLPANVDSLAIYEGKFKFGQLTEGGIKFDVFRFLSFTGSYELAAVFPEFEFWPWLGSILIQYTASSAITQFSDDIARSSPIFGPIMYFILKNAFFYAFYTAMKDEMYWPFNSDPPLTSVSLKLGVAITF